MADAVKVTLKKSGRLKPPVLTDPVLTKIGEEIVRKQKERWSKSVSANGDKAAPLSKPYLFRKAKIRRTNRPVRDMHLTGLLRDNFTLRKAANGIIRAEPTSREGRKHATSANAKDQMIGFSGTDVKTVYDETSAAYGKLAKEMWIPIG